MVAPRLPDPPETYQARYINELLRALRQFFETITAVRPINATTLNLDIQRLPTQADLPNLRSGDVYRDTSAGDVLKIKP